MASKTYALLVGIDDYSPEIGKLNGCVNDIRNMQSFLESTHDDQPLETMRLENSDATRANIIDSFDSFLSFAKPSDTVLFHYSGHGARSRSAPEFQKYFSDGMDEGLVCYDSRKSGQHDLVDKEIAQLLYRIGKKQTHLVCIMDCCHSGYATRNGLESPEQLSPRKARSTCENSEKRSLDSYLDGFYAAEVKRAGDLRIHTAQHILLAACRHDQKAWESDAHQGMFTQSLLEVLQNSPRDLSYAELFVRTRHAVRKRITNQEPQFATFQNFDSGAGFLGHPNQHRRKRFNIFFDENWQVNCGAIHGLPIDFDAPAEFSVFENADAQEPLGSVIATVVGAQTSQIDPAGLAIFANGSAAKQSVFPATITTLPVPPLEIWTVGNVAAFEERNDLISGDTSQGITLTPDRANQLYSMRVQEEQYEVIDLRTNECLHVVPRNTTDAELYLLNVLKRIARWERRIALQNRFSKFDHQLFDFDFQLAVPSEDGQTLPSEDGKEILRVVPGRGDSFETRVEGELRVRNRTKQAVHVTLLHFSDEFGIASLYSEPVESSEQWVTLTPCGESLIGLYLKSSEPTGTTTQFKLIVSSEKIDDFLLEQDAIPKGERDTNQRNRRTGKHRKIKNDWFAKDLKIQMLRQSGSVSSRDVELLGGQLKIRANQTVEASVFEIPLAKFVRGLPLDRTALFLEEHPQVEPIVFSGDSEADVDRVVGVELSAFRNGQQLQEFPLRFEFKIPLQASERLLPVWFDGEQAVFEEVQPLAGGKFGFSLNRLPTSDASSGLELPAIQIYFFMTGLPT
jgi:hypothetical protein